MKLNNGDTITTIYGDTAVIVDIGKWDKASGYDECTKLDRAIQIGFYNDGVPCINPYISTSELYEICKKVNS